MRPTLKSLSAILLLPALLGGCGAYLYSPSRDSSTKAVKDAMASLNAPDYLAAQAKTLAAFAGEEDKALAAMLVGGRDLSLLNIVRRGSATTDPRTPAQLLASYIGDELATYAGVRTLDRKTSTIAQTRPYSLETAQDRGAGSARGLPPLVRSYAGAGGARNVSCAAVLKAPDAAAGESAEAQFYYAQIQTVCAVQAVQQDLIVSGCALGLARGRLRETCLEIEAGAAAGAADKRAGPLRDAIAAMRRLANAPRPGGLAAQASALVADAESKIAAAGAASTDARYAAVLKALNAIFAIDLGGAIEAVADATGNERATAARQDVLAGLRLIDAIDAAATPAGPVLDEPSALLIGIAKTQHDLNMVMIDLDVARRKIAVRRQEAQALRSAVSLLARAQSRLCRYRACPPAAPRQTFGEALSEYLGAVDRGIIPYQVLEFRHIQIDRAAAVERAKVTEADYRALVQPAIDELARYGEGGVRPDTLGPFLAGLPVTGAILGK